MAKDSVKKDVICSKDSQAVVRRSNAKDAARACRSHLRESTWYPAGKNVIVTLACDIMLQVFNTGRYP
ncbi:hypothetical protein KU6B_31030 [Mameliella alba]|nr:hypothetical protein KU6B_31030 [Mameliella alba]